MSSRMISWAATGPVSSSRTVFAGLRIDPKREKGTANPFEVHELRKLGYTTRNCLEASRDAVG